MAANNPMAVANSASAIPGATTVRFVLFEVAIAEKLFIIPYTVPKRPMNGAVEPTEARNNNFFSSLSNSIFICTFMAFSILPLTPSIDIFLCILKVVFHSFIPALNIFAIGLFLEFR